MQITLLEAFMFVQSVVFGSITFFAGYVLMADAIKWTKVISASNSFVTRLLVAVLGLSMITGSLGVLDSIQKMYASVCLIIVSGLYVHFENEMK